MFNTTMKQALISANAHTMKANKKFHKTVHPIVPSPVVIQVSHRLNRYAKPVKARSHVFKVSHITGIGTNRKAITEGGDMYEFIDRGNGFLTATK